MPTRARRGFCGEALRAQDLREQEGALDGLAHDLGRQKQALGRGHVSVKHQNGSCRENTLRQRSGCQTQAGRRQRRPRSGAPRHRPCRFKDTCHEHRSLEIGSISNAPARRKRVKEAGGIRHQKSSTDESGSPEKAPVKGTRVNVNESYLQLAYREKGVSSTHLSAPTI